MKGKLIIITAPSGAGKTTIVRHLLAACPHLEFSISAATRPQRKNEAQGRDYYFMTEAEFKNKIADGDFLEWEEVYKGNFYGTLKNEVQRIWDSGKQVVFDIDVRGALNLKKLYRDDALAIFIKPPSPEVLLQRLKGRATENPSSLEERIRKAENELPYESLFDAVIVNDDLQEAVHKAKHLVSAFCNKQ